MNLKNIVEILFKAGVKINYADEDSNSYLLEASETSDENMVQMFLKAGTNPNCMDDIGYTPLRIACSLGNKNIVNILLKRQGLILMT